MSSKFNEELLVSVASQVFEEAAFIFSDPVDQPPPFDSPVVMAMMNFEGPESGRLVLAASYKFATELAANLLGVDLDDPELKDKAAGAIGEMLNMISGVMTAQAFGDEVLVKFSVPDLKVLEPDGYEKIKMAASVSGSMMAEEISRVEIAAFLD